MISQYLQGQLCFSACSSSSSGARVYAHRFQEMQKLPQQMFFFCFLKADQDVSSEASQVSGCMFPRKHLEHTGSIASGMKAYITDISCVSLISTLREKARGN